MTPELEVQFRERLIQDLEGRSIPGIPAYIALWSVIVLAAGFHRSNTAVVYSAWVAFLGVCALRLIYQFVNDTCGYLAGDDDLMDV